MKELTSTVDLNDDDVKVSVTSRWILSNLTMSLGHHLSCTCKITKHGTIIYGNLLLALSKALHNKHKMNTTEEKPSTSQNLAVSKCSDDALDQVAEHINTTLRAQIRKYLMEDKLVPFQFDKFNINQLIEDMDPISWSFMCKLTQSM